MPRYRVTITGKNYDTMADLIRKHNLNLAGHTAKKAGAGRFIVDAFADSEQIGQLQSAGYEVTTHEDVQEAGTRRQSEVRPLAARTAARNVATANHYLNVDDIESALAAAAGGANAAFTQLIKLPNKTWEGRECHAIKIAHGNQPGRKGIYFRFLSRICG